MTIQDWLSSTTRALQRAGIESARLDALMLLEDQIDKNRAHVLAHPETPLSDEHISALSVQVERRKLHEPLAYIRGKAEFYGRDFVVNKNVLQPRPESETMIDMLTKLPLRTGTTIVDVGTGSGVLAVTAKLELPESSVIAIDIDEECLKVARINSHALGADIMCIQGDLVMPLKDMQVGEYLLLCNLPYVPTALEINKAAAHEPRLAIYGGQDGLDVFRRLFDQLKTLEQKPAYILTESLHTEHAALASLATTQGYVLCGNHNFIQVFASY